MRAQTGRMYFTRELPWLRHVGTGALALAGFFIARDGRGLSPGRARIAQNFTPTRA